VRYGDTLYSIAWRYGTTVWALTVANHLPNPNWIFAGQSLCIP
jgi:LysM repeat protein